MARYKNYSYEQTTMIPISFDRQIRPGTFEYALNYIVDNELDLSVFDTKYRNDATGAPAYDPSILLKIVLYAYSKGIHTSREIEAACRENVLFMALSAYTQTINSGSAIHGLPMLISTADLRIRIRRNITINGSMLMISNMTGEQTH